MIPGAAVYFTLSKRQLAMAQDRYELLLDNLRSLALAIEGMRQLERHGGGHMMERAFTGFAAIAPPDAWYDVLCLKPDAPLEAAESAFRLLAQRHHPDKPGGSTEKMQALNRALAEARQAHG